MHGRLWQDAVHRREAQEPACQRLQDSVVTRSGSEAGGVLFTRSSITRGLLLEVTVSVASTLGTARMHYFND